MTEPIVVSTSKRQGDRDLISALLASALIVAVLAALAFWPARVWTPPRRPGLTPPIVFDDFIQTSSPRPAAASGPDGTAN